VFSPIGGWCFQDNSLSNIRYKYPQILAATGLGFEKEKERAWDGFWNESIVDIARTAIADLETLTIVVTGRRLSFGGVVTSMLEAKGLNFDLVVLNPDPTLDSSTLDFKLEFFGELLHGCGIKEVVAYEDRAPHRKAFQKFFKGKGLKCQVHLVEMEMIYLDPVVEKELIVGLMTCNPAVTHIPDDMVGYQQLELEN
jgi:hypothetical protein